jgi:hypothetical protein
LDFPFIEQQALPKHTPEEDTTVSVGTHCNFSNIDVMVARMEQPKAKESRRCFKFY